MVKAIGKGIICGFAVIGAATTGAAACCLIAKKTGKDVKIGKLTFSSSVDENNKKVASINLK